MRATVTSIDKIDGITRVRLSRGFRDNTLDGRHYDLKVGDKIECKRVPNNPYIVRVFSN